MEKNRLLYGTFCLFGVWIIRYFSLDVIIPVNSFQCSYTILQPPSSSAIVHSVFIIGPKPIKRNKSFEFVIYVHTPAFGNTIQYNY